MSKELTVLRTISADLASLVARVNASVVAIGGRGQPPTTGTIVGPDLVLVIDHVIEAPDGLVVRTADDRKLDATMAGRDPLRDLAVVRVPELNGTALVPSGALPALGDLVVNVSRGPDGSPAASAGVVGSIGGPVKLGYGWRLERVIRADIAATRGVSGSPLVSAAGEILGVVNAGLARGVPLVVPYGEIVETLRALAEHGRIKRGYLGIGVQSVALPARQRGDEHRRGLLVISIAPDSPADAAGLLVGDIIASAAGSTTVDVDDLHQHLAGDHVGTPLALEVLRGGHAVRVDVLVGERT